MAKGAVRANSSPLLTGKYTGNLRNFALGNRTSVLQVPQSAEESGALSASGTGVREWRAKPDSLWRRATKVQFQGHLIVRKTTRGERPPKAFPDNGVQSECGREAPFGLHRVRSSQPDGNCLSRVLSIVVP